MLKTQIKASDADIPLLDGISGWSPKLEYKVSECNSSGSSLTNSNTSFPIDHPLLASKMLRSGDTSDTDPDGLQLNKIHSIFFISFFELSISF